MPQWLRRGSKMTTALVRGADEGRVDRRAALKRELAWELCFPGAMQHEVLLRRTGTLPDAALRYGPDSAAHRSAKGYALRCVRGTSYLSVAVNASENSSSVRSSRSGVTDT